MRKLTRFWRALERVPGLAAIPAFWERHCGSEYGVLKPFLRPTDVAGAKYPCPRPIGEGCPRTIMDYGAGDIVAVCRDPWQNCGDVPLKRPDTLLHEVDVAGLTKAIAGPLGIRWHVPQPKPRGACAFGTCSRRHYDRPAYFLCHTCSERFGSSLKDLVFDAPGALLVLAPTARHLTADLCDALARKSGEFMALEETLGLAESGDFVAIALPPGAVEPKATPVADRKRIVEEFRHLHGRTVQAICDEARVHRSDFYKWLAGKLADHLDKAKRIEHFLRSAPDQ